LRGFVGGFVETALTRSFQRMCQRSGAMVTATRSKEKTVKNRMVDFFSTQPLPD